MRAARAVPLRARGPARRGDVPLGVRRSARALSETRARRSRLGTPHLSESRCRGRARELRGRSPRRSHAWCRSARVATAVIPLAYALDPETRAWLAREVDACHTLESRLRARTRGRRRRRECLHSAASRRTGRGAATRAPRTSARRSRGRSWTRWPRRGARGAHRIGAVAARLRAAGIEPAASSSPTRTRRRCAQSCTIDVPSRWGPARATVEEAVADRKAMRAAIQAGALDEWLRRSARRAGLRER